MYSMTSSLCICWLSTVLLSNKEIAWTTIKKSFKDGSQWDYMKYYTKINLREIYNEDKTGYM
jgi:hypothetical protein